MPFRVICISHADGAGGDEVGRSVADMLGFRLVDEEIVMQAAREARVDPAIVAAAEKKQSLLQRVLDSLASAQEMFGSATLAAAFAVPVTLDTGLRRSDREDLRLLIRATILEVAKAGNAVIIAHAASFALAGRPGVLRVLVTAPASVRSGRIAQARGLSAAEADEAIERGDAGRRDYLSSFYDVDEELPTHYDLVLSTEILTPVQAATAIVSTASA